MPIKCSHFDEIQRIRKPKYATQRKQVCQYFGAIFKCSHLLDNFIAGEILRDNSSYRISPEFDFADFD